MVHSMSRAHKSVLDFVLLVLVVAIDLLVLQCGRRIAGLLSRDWPNHCHVSLQHWVN